MCYCETVFWKAFAGNSILNYNLNISSLYVKPEQQPLASLLKSHKKSNSTEKRPVPKNVSTINKTRNSSSENLF